MSTGAAPLQPNQGDEANRPESFFPSSVEEAGALLGMSITQCGMVGQLQPGQMQLGAKSLAPPAGMHSSFRVLQPVPNTDLMSRLYQLRALLRSSPSKEPLVAAPSLLAVLIKLLGVSTSLAPAYTGSGRSTSGGSVADPGITVPQPRPATPPMYSNALRHLWVECVTLCHIRGAGLSGNSRINTTQFIRQMLSLAATNPRSAKCAGGVRTAALDVVAALLKAEAEEGSEAASLVTQIAPWALDILQICLKAIRSAGNGEATYRLSAVDTAIATAVASRRAYLKRQAQRGEIVDFQLALCLKGAMEEKALLEAVKFLKQATQDKVPEVRSGAARFAATLSPLLISSNGSTSILEEVMSICWKNLDDESAFCSNQWAEALARILATTLQYHGDKNSSSGSGSAGSPQKGGGHVGVGDLSGEEGSRRRGRATLFSEATSLKRTISYLSDHFVKAGGELVATRMGGAFSVGGRAVRVGIGQVISKLLQLRSHLGEDIASGMTPTETLFAVLKLLGPEMDKQLRPPDPGASGSLMQQMGSRSWSKADAGVARAITGRVLREGISQVSAESTQLSFLQDLVAALPSTGQNGAEIPGSPDPNPNQLQCVLVEISHLIATLGEAAMAKMEETLASLKLCLEHNASGVRHEAAVACHSLCVFFPQMAGKLILSACEGMQMHHAQLMTVSSSAAPTAEASQKGMRMFRSGGGKKSSGIDERLTIPHQNAIHGLSVMVAMLVRELPHCSGGLPESLAKTVVSVGEILVSSQFNELLAKSCESAACACVRAGFLMISGIMAGGPYGAAEHIPRIFGAWQKASNSIKTGGSLLAPHHDLVCVDSLLYSMVVFLKYCSELLLSIPEALTQVTVLLEETLPLLTSEGRLGSIPLTPHISARLESACASLLEAFAWLPAGSYPMAADTVFAFSAEQIQSSVYSEISCSILPELLQKEDGLLDTTSLERMKRDGQSGGAIDLELMNSILTGEFSHHSEMEAVLHLRERGEVDRINSNSVTFRASHILGMTSAKKHSHRPPTPLHEVGMWRRPMEPSSSAKIRLVDAAVQAFAATFGLKSGKEQQSAMNMLENLVPQYFSQITRSLNPTDQSKLKDETAAVSNVTAVLLLCLQSLPLHEATHNVPIGLGPPWMTKAKDILLLLLPSASNNVRRAAAEGLALLATLGVSEDAHFLQSTVLHSLDEVRQGSRADGKSRSVAVAASLLTLACIQRSASLVAQRKLERARSRLETGANQSPRDKEAELPVIQMMTRILPSISHLGFADFFEVRTYALQSFQILLSYSSRLDKASWDDVDLHLLRKAVEVIEDNVCSAWIVASNELDHGNEGQKVAAEDGFLAVALRLMSFVTPYLRRLEKEDNCILSRFCVMARLILERRGGHPAVATEGMIFYEVLTGQENLIPPLSGQVADSDNLKLSMMPVVSDILTPADASKYAAPPKQVSFQTLRASVFLLQAMEGSQFSLIGNKADIKTVALLTGALEWMAGWKRFIGTGLLRSMVIPRRVEAGLSESDQLVAELIVSVLAIALGETVNSADKSQIHLKCLLFAKIILSGMGSGDDGEDRSLVDRDNVAKAASDAARLDASAIFRYVKSTRWQTKALGAHLASFCLGGMLKSVEGEPIDSHHLNIVRASSWCEEECRKSREAAGPLPNSLLAFHLQDLVSSSCMSSVASLDQSELYSVQQASLNYLSLVIKGFSRIPDPDMPGSDILHQYSQQIYSVVKHSLGSLKEVQTEASFRVFIAGGDTVSTIIRERMTTELAVLKRLVRPIVPEPDDLAVIPWGENIVEPPFSDGTYSTMIKRAKVAFTADLLFGGVPAQQEELKRVSADLVSNLPAFGVESAIFSLEGAKVLKEQGLSLVGVEASPKDEDEEGVFSWSEYSADSIAMEFITRSWPSAARGALNALSSAVLDESTNDAERGECYKWMKALGKLVLAGCEESVLVLGDQSRIASRRALAIDIETVSVECLRSLGVLLRLDVQLLDAGAIDSIAKLLQGNLVEPLLATKGATFSKGVVNELCSLYNDFSTHLAKINGSEGENSHEAMVLSFVLHPLALVQQGRLTGDRSSLVVSVINASLDATTSLAQKGFVPDALVGSLVDFLATTVLQSQDTFSLSLKESANILLLECMAKPFVSNNERKRVALLVAKAGLWDSWGALYSSNEVEDRESLIVLKQALAQAIGEDAHLQAFAAISKVANGVSTERLALVILGVGTEIMGLLQYYGTLASTKIQNYDAAKRQLCFAEAVKAVVMLYQQLLQMEFLSEFLATVFQSLLAVLRFNGLPNHPSREEKGNTALGRLVAQTVVHVARTSPDAFKSCMGSMIEQDRALVEFAARGEMTGYSQSTQSQAPVKKKLNLKSFKK